MKQHNCPLCQSKKTQLYHADDLREYHKCHFCDYVFVPEAFHLSSREEKARYDLHENYSNDSAYRAFLSQALNPLLTRLPAQAKGLDFGCGPGPTLSIMLEEHGHKVDLFDKFYAQNLSVFNQKYDFITATEVLEHLPKAKYELDRLYSLLKSGGLLVLMSELLSDEINFTDWYYKNDPSHIGFFSEKCLVWLAHCWQAELEIISSRVAVLTKNCLD